MGVHRNRAGCIGLLRVVVILTLSSDSHTVFIAVRPANMAGPPYADQAQSQWVDHYQLYWKQLSITVQGKPKLIQYGLAST